VPVGQLVAPPRNARRAPLAEPSWPAPRLNSSLSIDGATGQLAIEVVGAPPADGEATRRRVVSLASIARNARPGATAGAIPNTLVRLPHPRAAMHRFNDDGRRCSRRVEQRSSDAPCRSLVPLEAREPAAGALIVTGDAPRDDGRDGGSPVATGAGAAGEGRGDVVQRFH
jgi:hypothetical protein